MSRYSKVVRKKKQKERLSFLPEAVRVFIARRILDFFGLFFVLSGAGFLLAQLSYNPADPSWNTAVPPEASVANWLGKPGALIGDLFIQTLGYAGLVLAALFMTWGVRLFRRQALSPFAPRLTAALAGTIFLAIGLARIPSGSLLVHPWLGGSGGTIILDKIAGLAGAFLGGWEHTVVAIIAGLLALPLLLYSFCITRQQALAAVKATAHFISYSAQTLFYNGLAFIDWVRHYNDPAYRAEKAAIKQKPKKAKKPKKEKAASTATRTIPESAPEKDKAPIRVSQPTKLKTSSSRQSSFALDGSEWELPDVELLQESSAEEEAAQPDEEALRKNAEMLQSVLKDFNVEGDIVSIHPGPVVTLYELEPAPGVKTSRVIGLSDDIARSMAAVSVRSAVVPGRNVIGIEMPNSQRQTVYLREILETADARKTKAALPLILGKDIGGRPVIADLAKMPHLLVAGTTGSGKSVAVNTMILSLLYRLPPEKCRLIMIDPKMLELSIYDDIPHLLSPVVTEPGKAVVALKWAVAEMEERYRAMSKLGVRNIEGYNQRLRQAVKKGETLMRKVQTGFDPETGKPIWEEQPLDTTELPYIVIVVDEFADLMLVAGKDVENAVQRLAQMARAAGIHLIMATQRPSTDVITGIIKANFPTRISFQVTSKIDSRVILNEGGAEQLLGMGDMLYQAAGGQLKRVHGPFVSDEDVENVVTFLKHQGEPAYVRDVTEGGSAGDSEIMNALFSDGDGADELDELYDQAVAIVAKTQKASTSFIQRQLKIGYNRAANIIEEMEAQGVISQADHVGRREVLISDFSDA